MRKNILLLLLSLLSFSAIHAEEDIKWSLSDDGTLTISGTKMPDYTISYQAPWCKDHNCLKIKTVVIEDGVTNIGNDAFYNCTNLTSVTIPNSVTIIGDGVFWNCVSLPSIIIPKSVTGIYPHAFYDCYGLSSIIVEEGNKNFDSRDNCNAIIRTASNALFLGCKNTVIPNSVTSIESEAFQYCEDLTSITIPNSVTSIGSRAFLGCIGLTSITIPNSVTRIESQAFDFCSHLTSVTIGNSVSNIAYHAFKGSTGLTSITFNGSTPPRFEEGVFGKVDNSVHVYVPANSIDAYKKVLGFSNIKEHPIYLTDNESYTRDSQIDGKDVIYTRNFTNVKWQSIYLPFSLKYDDLKDDFELACISSVHQYDNDKDGVIDKTEMEIIKMKGGETVPNAPYLIRAKTTGEKTFSAVNATLYQAEENSVDCSTTIAKYTITGTYSPIPSETMIANNYYAMGGGELIQSDGSNGLKPYRWYMKVEARDYSKYKVSNAAKAITIKVLDDEETTGIDELQIANSNSSVYDINGRKVNENSLKPGMYIKNGRKFVIK